MNRTIPPLIAAVLAACLCAAPAAADVLSSYYDGQAAAWQVPDPAGQGRSPAAPAPTADEPGQIDNDYQDAFTETAPFEDVWDKPIQGLQCQSDDGYQGGKCAPAGCWCPCWEFNVDALILRREHTPGVQLSHRTGLRLGAARSIDYCRDIQLEFFYVDEWSHAAPGLAYGTDLYSWELNWRRHWRSGRLTTLAGFRVLESDESRLTAGGEEDIDNHLIGFQLGAEAIIWQTCRWEIETGMKAGVYHNSADYDAAGLAATLGADHTAFAGECWVGANYCLTNCIDLRIGYQAMWIEGVADMASMPPAAVALDMGGSPFYHGLYLGAQANW